MHLGSLHNTILQTMESRLPELWPQAPVRPWVMVPSRMAWEWQHGWSRIQSLVTSWEDWPSSLATPQTNVHTAANWVEFLALQQWCMLPICTYYDITTGTISIACDGLGPLTQCFAKYQSPNPTTPHHDLIISIWAMIAKTPIDWHLHHVAGHQHEKTVLLDWWADETSAWTVNPKAFWQQLQNQGFQPVSYKLPYEGWHSGWTG